MIIGGFVVQKQQHLDEVIEVGNIKSYAIALVVIGGITIAVAIFGLFAVHAQSNGQVFTFCGLLLGIIVLEVPLAFYMRGNKTHLGALYDQEIRKIYNSNKTVTIEYFQKNYKCCGVERSTEFQGSDLELPKSCCRADIIGAKCTLEHAYSEGCISAVQNAVFGYSNCIIYCIFLASLFEIAGLIFSVARYIFDFIKKSFRL